MVTAFVLLIYLHTTWFKRFSFNTLISVSDDLKADMVMQDPVTRFYTFIHTPPSHGVTKKARLIQKRLCEEAELRLAARDVRHCSCVMREKTPGGSFPSPSAARRPSCCRARANATSAWNVRGSVTARSLSTRRFNCTLHCGRSLHTKHQAFNTTYTHASSKAGFIPAVCFHFKSTALNSAETRD